MWNTGDRVLAHRPPGEFWYPGVIRHIQEGRYFVIYDDGEDGFVGAKQMLPLLLEVGDALFARAARGQDFQPARIIDKQDERLQLEYATGLLGWAETSQVRLRPSAPSTPRPVLEPTSWSVGDRVFACWFDLFWYTASIQAVNEAQMSVLFDHGGHALLPPDRVHALDLDAGERVEGRWQVGNEFYPGRVERRDGDVVAIAYDDGDHETTLVRLVRLQRDDWLPGEPLADLGSGDRVLGCWFDGFWYPGIILAVEGRRIHVLFDDNDQAYLTGDKVLPLDVAVGARVFCRWKGGPFYLPGEVMRRHGERIFVQYEDGREEWTSVRLLRLIHPDGRHEDAG